MPELALRVHHDEDCDVFLNGEQIASLTGYTVNYVDVPLPESAAEALRAGTNVIAIHCHQTGGGQYIDAGLVQVTEKPRQEK